MTPHEQNFISRIQTIVADTITLRARIEYELSLYDGDGFGAGITDSDFEEIDEWEHLTQSKMWNTIAALQDLYIQIGPLNVSPGLDLVKFKA